MDSRFGYAAIILGVILVLVGLLAVSGLLRWFGHLPGDIRHDGGSVKVFAPITSMLIVSGVASLLLALINRLR